MKRLALIAMVALTGCASQGGYKPEFHNYLSLPPGPDSVYDVRTPEQATIQGLSQPLLPNGSYRVMREDQLLGMVQKTVSGSCEGTVRTLYQFNQQLELMQRDANGSIDFTHPERMTDSQFLRNHLIHLQAWRVRYSCGK